MKLIYLVLLFCLWPALAWATCSSPISGKDGTGATINLGAVVDGSSNCWGGVSIVDGTAAANKAAVKAASTAAVATDPSLVVAISPNNTIAATQSGSWSLVNISGTVSLPTNAAQETGGNLATLAGAITSSVMQSNTKQVNGVTTLAGAGATGTGSQRVTAAQDTTTIAGSAPGTAGTASAQVVTVQGIASMTALLANPGTIATWGLAPVAAGSAPTNMQVGGLIYNSTPLTPTTGQSLALQGDANGYLNVHIQAGGGTGGTSLADNGAWTAGTTAQTPAGCEYTSGGATALTTGHVGTPGCTSARGLFTDLESVGGTALGAVISNLGTLATGTPATLNVNNYMVGCASTVCNANVTNAGTIAAAASSASPVTGFNYVLNGSTWYQMLGDTSGRPVVVGAGVAGTPAGGVMSVQGVASGTALGVSATSGAFASGSLASGAVVDLTNIEGVIGAATAPTKMAVAGVVYNSGGVTLTNGQSAATQATAQGMQTIVSGNITITGTSWNSSTGTSGATQTIINANAYASAYLVQLDQTTTITAGAITFQVSGDGGANWSTINAYQVVDPTSATGATISLPYTLQASTNKQFLIYPQGMAVRMEVSTTMTGTGAFQPFTTPLPATQNVALLPGANAVGTTTLGAGSANAGGVEVYDAAGTNKLNVVAASTAPVTATNTAAVVDLRPDSPGIITLGPAAVANAVPFTLSSQYPTNATTTTPAPETISAAGTTAATTATLATASGVTTYICGAEVDAYATAATAVSMTITGVITGTMTFTEFVGTTALGAGAGRNVFQFNPCIPASTTNTTISVVSGAAGTGGVVNVNAWGYKL